MLGPALRLSFAAATKWFAPRLRPERHLLPGLAGSSGGAARLREDATPPPFPWNLPSTALAPTRKCRHHPADRKLPLPKASSDFSPETHPSWITRRETETSSSLSH
ncbi:hypothetical protein GUJ93_ZPchr0001g31635 [Zizania palustris]|uniref:Uncharacterized protein n=1 Tax=Zizania palustris TaxID=103762 RepID=A0A8J5S1R2_ZIZPA|nr:hypothetical protein GUJ93_ZPchr0001g31635 [Zizania palustris]